MTVGIYQIINTVSRKIYVGSSNDTEHRRREHFRKLRNNRHTNQHLQAAWNKYGSEAFQFEVILECPVEELRSVEQQLLDKLDFNQTYNIALDAAAPTRGRTFMNRKRPGPPSHEHRTNLSRAMKRKPVERICPSTGIVTEYECMRAVKADGHDHRAVSACCRGGSARKTHHGFYWGIYA